MKWAKEKAVPKWAASAALSPLDPSSQTGGVVGPLGMALTSA
jgi:hypothetical protein